MTSVPASGRLRAWDKRLAWGSLTVAVVAAWLYTAAEARRTYAMDGMPMPGMGMGPWGATEYLAMFLMWAVMMVAMMVPTALRAVAIYARVVATAERNGSEIAATWSFVSGYALAWTAFSGAATVLQALLDQAGLLSSQMVLSSGLLGAALVVIAGLYQLTPWKDACLRHCQSPAGYLAGRFAPGVARGVQLGVYHGMYCLGCCWALMVLLFVGGVMNVVWIAVITIFVIAEKLLPASWQVARIASTGMIGVGSALFVIQLT